MAIFISLGCKISSATKKLTPKQNGPSEEQNSERPRTERPVWQTKQKSVQLQNGRFIYSERPKTKHSVFGIFH